MVKSKKYPGVEYNELQNGDRTYYIRYKSASGKTVRESLGRKSMGITEAYCSKKRNERLLTIKTGGMDPMLESKMVITLNELSKFYFDDKALTNRSNHAKIGMYNMVFRDTLGYKKINKIASEDIKSIQKSMLKTGKKPKTINGYVNLISNMFNYALESGHYNGTNPAKNVKALKVDNKRARFLNSAEVALLFETLKDSFLLLLFVRLSLSTGGRFETVRHIRKKDINFESQRITLQDFKNETTYHGFYDLETEKMLLEHVADLGPNDYIFHNGAGTIYPQRSLQRNLKNIMDALFNEGLEKGDSKNRAVIHTLRHTCASHLALKGVSLQKIQKILNHKDIHQTMRYSHLLPDSGQAEIQNLFV